MNQIAQTSSPYPLFRRLPQFHELSNDLILDRFLEFVTEKGLTLYPAQEEAILALFEGQNVILNTPTGSGKSLVALAMHFYSLAMGRRSVYTCPIKALVNEKFLSLCREFGPEQVGMSTGDGSVNRDAPILCCTAEILSNLALREGDLAKVDDIVMDEFHYYSDRERGAAWQIPLLTMPQSRFLLMSATLGEMDFFKTEISDLTKKETMVISGTDRPVPLTFEYRETPLHETLKDLMGRNLAPIYLVNFTQREAAEEAQNLMSVDFISKEQKKIISERLSGVRFSSPYGKDVSRFLRHGVGIHHAGLLPKYRILVEKLAQEGLLKVISGTDTLGVGVNIPLRTVLFTKLCKYDGEKTAILSVRDFHQIAGRAGRKGFDDAGCVAAQAPEHIIENTKLEQKAKADPKKAKKIVKAKPPEKGFVLWNEATFQKLIKSQPEPLQSRFQITHAMLLNVLAREHEDGCKAMREIIRNTHETEAEKRKHRARAWILFRSLLDRKIVELGDHRVRVNVSLQDDFSLNQTLSLWLLDTIEKLDPESETYALDLLTLVEAILESPDLILRKQVDRARNIRFQELREAGVEYEERQEELEKVEHPKPLRDFIYSTFNEFSDLHPWVGTENIRPKSVAREMYEMFLSFPEYIKEYDLQRAEGVLLRYISDVYRALVQTVPDVAKNEDVMMVIEYFGSIVRQVDSSLMDEWERLRLGGGANPSTKGLAPESVGEDLDQKAARLLEEKNIRRKVTIQAFRFLRAFGLGAMEDALEILQEWASDPAWTVETLAARLEEYRQSEHKGGPRLDPPARHAMHGAIKSISDGEWVFTQRLIDNDEHNDWQLMIQIKKETQTDTGLRFELQSISEI